MTLGRTHARPDPDEWRRSAACRTVDPAIFFPADGGRGAYDAAKAICAGCPVVDTCLTWALDHPREADDGVWGGKSPSARTRILRGHTRRPQQVAS